MPQAAAHILIPLLVASIYRDMWISKNDKRKFPLHYVLIAGISGIIPDLDILAFWILGSFGFTFTEVHRTFAHTIFVPLIFIALALVSHKIKVPQLGRHKLKLHVIFLVMAFGSFMHLFLDGTFAGYIAPFYPFSLTLIGINLFGYLPAHLINLAAPCLDAGLLIIYLIYLEWKHKISDFI